MIRRIILSLVCISPLLTLLTPPSVVGGAVLLLSTFVLAVLGAYGLVSIRRFKWQNEELERVNSEARVVSNELMRRLDHDERMAAVQARLNHDQPAWGGPLLTHATIDPFRSER